MKRTIAKNTLSFSTSKTMQYLRTPPDIWESINNEFNFTLDACASDENHLCEKYYTKDNSCLDKDWTGEVVYCHPLFPNVEVRFLEKPNKGFRFGKDDGSEDDPTKIGYIKPLMIVVFCNI